MIKCLAIDDEPLALNKLKRNILKFPYLELVGAYLNVERAQKILETDQIDVVFIDIEMPDTNGLRFIQQMERPPMVVFVTAYPQYALESYSVSAIDYLLKPYSSEQFEKTVEKVYRQWSLLNAKNENENNEDENIFLKSEYKFIRVLVTDIIYLEGMNEYIKVHRKSDNPFLTLTTFNKLEEKLPKHFIQIHRSYMVNMNHVKSITSNNVILDDGTVLPIGKTKKDGLQAYMTTNVK